MPPRKNQVMGEHHYAYQVEWLDVDELLKVKPSYQRELRDADIRHYVEHWDIRLCDPVRVAKYPDGHYEIVDGQHRAHAFKRRFETGEIHCFVAAVEKPEQAAAWFVACNTKRRLLSGGDLWTGRREAKDSGTLTIEALCSHHSLVLANGAARTKPGVLGCRGALREIVARHGDERLNQVLRVLAECWRNYAFFQKTHWVLALDSVFETLSKDPNFDENAVIEKLRKTQPEVILAKYEVPGQPGTSSVPRARDAILAAVA